jgi:hypothetical protein
MTKKNNWTLYVEVKDGTPEQELVAALKKLTKKKCQISTVPKQAYTLAMEWKFTDPNEAVALAEKFSHENIVFICVRKDL